MAERGQGIRSLKQFLKENPGVLLLDFTQLTLFEHCAMKYHYIYHLNLMDHVHPAAAFSSEIVHPILVEWHASGSIPSSQKWQAVWKKFMVAIADVRLTNKQLRTYTLDNAVHVIREYTERFLPDHQTYKVVSTEEVYWTTLDEIDDVVLVSKPDLVLSRVDGKLVTADFKASSYSFNANLIPFDRQFIGQAYMANASFMMKRFINLEAVDVEGRDTRQILSEIQPIDKDLLDEWKRDIVQSARDIKSASANDTWVKRAPRACNEFNRRCKFHDICMLGSSKGVTIESMETRNPLEYLGL